uniref:G protein pathway suppressor 1 n=1 Tax=Mus musculus TaxID=10090 RepID=D6RCV3_MOUSE
MPLPVQVFNLQQVRLAARHGGRLQPERQPVGLHVAFRGGRGTHAD